MIVSMLLVPSVSSLWFYLAIPCNISWIPQVFRWKDVDPLIYATYLKESWKPKIHLVSTLIPCAWACIREILRSKMGLLRKITK